MIQSRSGDQAPRARRPATSIKAKWPGTCARCHLPFAAGDSVHHDADDALVHHRHLSGDAVVYANEGVVHRVAAICPGCQMAQPCECD